MTGSLLTNDNFTASMVATATHIAYNNHNNNYTSGLECHTADNLQCVITEGVVTECGAEIHDRGNLQIRERAILGGGKRRCELLAMVGVKIG